MGRRKNLKIGQLKLSSQRAERKKNEEKWTKPKRPVGHCQIYWHKYNRILGWGESEKRLCDFCPRQCSRREKDFIISIFSLILLPTQLSVGMGRTWPVHLWWILFTWFSSRNGPAALLVSSHQLLQGHEAGGETRRSSSCLCLFLC